MAWTMAEDLDRFSNAFQSEADLRAQLSTLLSKMGNEGVQITHGSQEYGKDIIFYSYDAMGSRMLNACVVKNDKISGNVNENRGATTVFAQVEQALEIPHINSCGENELVARVYVIAPYDCPQTTLRSIQGKLKARSGQVDFLCGSRLLERFAKFWPEFLAFESSFLSSYVAELQREFEQEDPIRFLGGQHNLFSGANKSLNSVYVQQQFKVEIHGQELLAEMPLVDCLKAKVSLAGLKDLTEQLNFSSALVRNPQAWEAGSFADAAALADQLDALALRIRRLWEEQWRLHETESSESGKAAVPKAAVKLQIPSSMIAEDDPVYQKLQEVLVALDARLVRSNEFATKALSGGLESHKLKSAGYVDYSRIADIARAHPVAFRRGTRSKIFRFDRNLIHQISLPVFVTAPAGHGKTSFCKWHTLSDVRRLLDKTSTVSPVYVPLHRLSTVEVGDDVGIFFRAAESKELLALAKTQNRTVRIYLDGLDEVSTAAQQEKLMLLAARIPQVYPFVHVVVTGRDYLSGSWLRWLTRINLSELDDAQIKALVSNWLDGDQTHQEAFYEQLAKAPSLTPLMRVPLLGTLILAVFMRMKSLPENKLKLYEVFTELMCGGWDLAKNVRRNTVFGSNVKLGILTRLAGQLQLNGRRDAQEIHFCTAVEQTAPALLNKVSQLLDEILEDGLLVRASNATFIFSHLSFQEYLAATELTDPQGNRCLQALRDFLRGDDKWREVMSFYLSLSKRPDETEAWIRKTTEGLAGKGADVKQRYEFLIEELTAAWPGWSPRKAALRV